MVDAGHGGHDPGAQGNHLEEKQLNLLLAAEIADKLRARGHAVHMTRQDDTFLTLAQRVRAGNELGRALFISIHFNKSNNVEASGIETFYHTAQFLQDSTASADRSELLAAEVQLAMVHATGAIDRGIKNRGLYVLRNSRHPAILIEGGFVSNAMEAALIGQESYRRKLAQAVVAGVDAFLRTEAQTGDEQNKYAH